MELKLAHRAEALVDAGDCAQALALAEAALRLAPERAQAHAARARALRGLGDDAGALASLDALIARDAGNALAHDARAVLLGEAGRLAEAAQAFATALRLDPGLARAHFGLAMTGRVAPAHIRAMEALAAQSGRLDEAARLFLLYALAKAYDEAGEFDRAFAAAQAGAGLRRQRWRGDEAREIARLAGAAPRASSGAADPAEAPIFIVGAPRSGTSLVEQMLASHPEVVALGETEVFAEVGGDPAAYLARVSPAARRGRRIVDKSLGNALRLADIRRAFPRARILHVRRDPLDVGLSCYFAYLRDDSALPPDLAGLGRYLGAHARLMAAWREALPSETFYEIAYERLVAAPEAELRGLLAFGGLAWDARCLDFAASRRLVKTASFAQVREPAHTRAVGRWRPYEAHLGPFRAALAEEPC